MASFDNVFFRSLVPSSPLLVNRKTQIRVIHCTFESPKHSGTKPSESSGVGFRTKSSFNNELDNAEQYKVKRNYS